MHAAFVVLYVWKGARADERVVFGPRFAIYTPVVQMPDGSPALDARAAVREDANAIDALCRLALGTYDDWRTTAAGAPLRVDVDGEDRAVAADGTFDGRGAVDHGAPGSAEHAHRRRRRRFPSPIGGCREPRPRVSVVMPAFNEAEILGTSVKSVVDGLRGAGRAVRGARRRERFDRRTLAIAERARGGVPRGAVEHRDEADYGRALRSGLLDATRRRRRQLRHRLLRSRLPRRRRRRRCSPTTARRSSSAPSAARARPTTATRSASSRRSCSRTILRVVFGLRVSDTHGIKAMRRAAVEPYARDLHVRPGPVRHRADPAGRAGRAAHRGDPGRGARAAARAQLVHHPRAAYAARTVQTPLGAVEGIPGR